MCDGKLASKRDVVILSIKPKRPEYPSCQKVVPVSELLQEWDKLDAYYRGQLLKLQKSFSKSNNSKSSHHHNSRKNSSRHSSPNNQKVNKHNNQKSSYPVNKKLSSSLSSDQFTELFGDENLFSPASGVGGADTNNNSNRNHHHHSKNKSNKLLPSRSLNSLFSDDDDDEDDLSLDELPPPHPPHHKSSRKSSLSSVNGNLVVSIPVLSVPQNYNKRSKYFSDEDDEDNESGVSEVDDDNDNCHHTENEENFLSVPRDNFQVQYGIKQKTRVALLEHTGNVSPRFIVPVRVAPYKPPAAQGLNGVQIQKILYHKNDKVNYASPTTTTARTPDKPPDNNSASPPITLKSSKVSSVNNSPVNSTVSPRSGTTQVGITVTPALDNNNATPKQTASRTPELASPQSDQGYKSSSSTSSKLSSPPVNVNSTTGNSSSSGNHNYPPPSSQQNKLKRPISLTESYSSTYGGGAHGKKQRLGGGGSSDHGGYNPLDRSPSGYNFTSVTSSNSSTNSGNFAFSSLSSTHSQSKSSSCSSLFDGDDLMTPQDTHQSPLNNHRSRHSSTSSSSSASRLSMNNLNNPPSQEKDNSVEKSAANYSSPPNSKNSHKKLNVINKNPSFVRPPSTSTSSTSSSTNSTSSSSSNSANAGGGSGGASGVDRDHSVFLAPAAVSITDRIIKKASRPQPELIERQRRRRMESNQRKNYALKMGDEHEERESIDLSMKSFEMIWNVPLLSPLRSP